MPIFQNATGNSVAGRRTRYRLTDSLAMAGAWIRRRVRETRTTAALRALDDHTLRDIGVHRSEIASVARRLAQGDDTRHKHWTVR